MPDVKQYIPQDDPFVMISDLISIGETEAVSKFYIDENCVFLWNGFLDESGIIENIAQTAAAMSGYNDIRNGDEIKKGFIGSVEKAIIYELPVANKMIQTKVVIENIVLNVNIIKGVVMQNDKIMAECKMKIFLEN